MDHQELLNKWNLYKESRLPEELETGSILEKSKIVYDPEKRQLMIAALFFWKFFRKNFEYQPKEVRYHFLKNFEFDVNPLIGIIARLEFFTTITFRKMLWEYNMDFMSFESFLRRLSKSQIEAINNNYNDIMLDKTPRVLEKQKITWLKPIGGEFTGITYKNKQFVHRYDTKGEWSYNLAFLKFGFHAYPNVTEDDEKVIEVSPLKFFSAHPKNFVVQKEFGGIYWWFYKNARSNFVYRPNRKVELKNHICPGFYWTIMMHLMFWVISPLCMFYSPVSAVMKDWSYPVGLIISLTIASFTGLWIWLASLKLIFIGIKKSAVFLKDWVPEKVKDKNVLSVLIALLLIVYGILVVAILAFSSLIWLKDWHQDTLYLVGSIIRIVTVLAYALPMIDDKDTGKEIKEKVDSLKKVNISLLGIYVLSVIINFFNEIYNGLSIALDWTVEAAITVFNWLIWFFPAALDWLIVVIPAFFVYTYDTLIYVASICLQLFSFLGIYALTVIGAAIAPILFIGAVIKFTDERKYPKISRLIDKCYQYFFKILLASAGIAAIYFFVNSAFIEKTSQYHLESEYSWPLFIFSIMLIVFYAFNAVRILKHDKRMREDYKIVNDNYPWCNNENFTKSYLNKVVMIIHDNKYLRKLNPKEKLKTINYLHNLVFNESRLGDILKKRLYNRKSVLLSFLSIDKENVIKELINLDKNFYEIGWKLINLIKNDSFYDWLKAMEEQPSYHIAVEKAETEIKKSRKKIEDRKKARKEKFKGSFVYKAAIYIKYLLIRSLEIFGIIGEIIYTIRNLGQFFLKKFCPFVLKSKNLMDGDREEESY